MLLPSPPLPSSTGNLAQLKGKCDLASINFRKRWRLDRSERALARHSWRAEVERRESAKGTGGCLWENGSTG
jgi:hypothetical protein